jgi:dsDNA-specific endonuclease/ATPase MutS2
MLYNSQESLANSTSMLEQKQNMLGAAYDKLEAKDKELEFLRQKLSREKDDLENRVLQESSEAREALTRVSLH